MKRTLILYILLVFCLLKVLPQETKIISTIDGAALNNSAIQIVTFDYMNSISDTLLTVDQNYWIKEFCTAIDLQRNIIYFLKEENVCGAHQKIVYAINLQSHEIDSVVNLDGYALLEVYSLFYDMFNNRLIYKDFANIKSYDLTTGENRTICPIDYSLYSISGGKPTYNPITNKLLYLGAKDTLNTYNNYSVYIDLSTGTIEKTLKFDHSVFSLFSLSCDILNNKYYAINILNDSIINFDPLTGQTTNIAPICFKNWGTIGGQVPVFDYYNKTLIIPIYKDQTSDIQSSLDLINPDAKTSTCISYQQCKFTQDQLLFSGKNIFLKLENNSLVASKCDNYIWYLNGMQIPNADSQYLTPPQSGYYKYSTNIGSEIYYSNEILYQPTSINLLTADKEINVYPNPISDELNIEFPQTLTGMKTLIMYDLYGNSIFSAKTNTFKSQYKIKTNPGIYFLKIFFDDNKVITKKVIII
jgi:hypothetical protein